MFLCDFTAVCEDHLWPVGAVLRAHSDWGAMFVYRNERPSFYTSAQGAGLFQAIMGPQFRCVLTGHSSSVQGPSTETCRQSGTYAFLPSGPLVKIQSELIWKGIGSLQLWIHFCSSFSLSVAFFLPLFIYLFFWLVFFGFFEFFLFFFPFIF